ncbi:MAG: MFS transporter [Anaerolineaceae bacterium]|nr:MFS transporter [Anaerolineaceae bacterium]
MASKPYRRFTTASYYFLYYAGAASLFPFLSLFYARMGLSGSQIGYLSALLPLIGLFASPFWTALADGTRQHKRILYLTTLGAVAAGLLILLSGGTFWLIPAIAGFALFSSPIMPLMDNETLRMLGGLKQQYGRIRLWGAIGWGISAPLMGRVIEQSGLQWAFWGYAGLILLSLLLTRLMVFTPGTSGSPFWLGMKQFMQNPAWILFLCIVFLGSLTLSTISNFLFLYMKSLGINEGVMGIALTIATVSEIPVLFFANRLLQRFSATHLLYAALVFIGLRALLLSFARTPVSFLLIQLLHGFSFSLAWSAGVSYADQMAPAGLSATAQGMYAGVQLGIGAAVGAILGGWLYQSIGAAAMYRLMALVMAVGLLLFLVLDQRFKHKQERNVYVKTI